MKPRKITWRVGDKPTGMYRSFDKRMWPMGYNNRAQGKCLFMLTSEVCYDAREKSDAGDHTRQTSPITISVADYRVTDRGFQWRKLKLRAYTMAEVKDRAEKFYNDNLDLFGES